MPITTDKPISLVQAARTLYHTPAPSDEQIDRVFRLMTSGDLPARDGGANRMRWTTTETALAEFMAENELRRTSHSRKARGRLTDRNSPATSNDQSRLQGVYRNIWRDYFLAVMLRRRTSHRTVGFQRAVLAGQVALLLALAGTVLFSASQIAGLAASPPERVAVTRWIEAHTDAYAIERWHPSERRDDGPLVCVEYRYRNGSPRWVHTKRYFQVVGDSATEVSLDED